MSDNAVDTQELDEGAVSEALLGTEDSLGSDDTESKDPTLGEEESEEQIDVSNLVGSQPENEQKKQNAAFARERVEKKRLKEELERLKSGNPEPDVSDLKRPKRSDFLTEKVLERFDYNETRALAAYDDALDDFNEQLNERKASASHNAQKSLAELQREYEAEEKFEEHAKAVAKRVPDFDAKIAEAERIFTPKGANMIKQRFGEKAPLMLASIGANPQYARQLAMMNDVVEFTRELTKLEVNVDKVMASSKTVSTAPSETAVSGGQSASMDSIQKEMDKAVKAGNHGKYRELKQKFKAAKNAHRKGAA